MKENDKGFTLVELIAVIAIMAILGGMLSAVVSQNGVRVSECANKISVALKETRTEALSKKAAYFTIAWNSDANKFVISETGKDTVKIGDSSTTVTVKYVLEGETTEHSFVLNESDEDVILTFNRASGAFRPMILSLDEEGTVTYKKESGKQMYCTGFVIERGSRSKEVVLVKDTGKVYINEETE